jgi:predicted HTH domain antitoxin
MTEIRITIPDDVFVAMKTHPSCIGDEIRLLAAVKLYEMGRLSSGAAAKMAGLSRVLFISKLKEFQVPALTLTEEEFSREAEILGIDHL